MTISDARRTVGQNLGLTDFDGSIAAFAALSPADQERVSIEATRYIIANPGRFTKEQVQAAQTIANKQNFGTLGNYQPSDTLDTASEFVKAYGEVAGDTIVGASKIAAKSAKELGINPGLFLGLIALAAIAYFGAPYVLPKLRAAFQKAPKPAA